MRNKLLLAALTILLAASTLASACDETTVTELDTTATVTVSVGSFESGILVPGADGDTLVRDTVRFFAVVALEGNVDTIISGTYSSSDPALVEIIEPDSGLAVLKGVGTATVTASITAPNLGSDPVTVELTVPVDSFNVQISVSSPTLAAGDTLLGDIVIYDVTVTQSKAGTQAAVVGKRFASSDPLVIEFIDDTMAAFVGTGQATVTVSFDEPKIPGTGSQPASALQMNITDFSLLLDIRSVSGTFADSGDFLLTDTVVVTARLVSGTDTTVVTNPTLSSTDPMIIEPVGAADSIAFFADTGTATLTVSFTDPVPRQQVSQSVRVTTFLVNVAGPNPPTMGDTVVYSATITDTRTGSAVPGTGQNFSSNDATTIEVVNSTSGLSFARDIGSADVRVTFTDPVLPNAQVEGVLPVQITQELFYGSMSDTSGAFLDNRTIFGTAVHRFTDSTLVQLQNGTVLFRESFTASQLQSVVGAGTNTSVLTFQNLLADDGSDRDNVASRFMFNGLGGVADAFELNDNTGQLGPSLKVVAPFDEVISWDPSKSAPADSDFFYIGVLATPDTFDISAEWQQNSDIDFKVCLGDPFDPPSTYNGAVCARFPADNTVGGNTETALALELSAGTHVIVFYCVQNCTAEPITYRVKVDQTP